MQHFPIFQLVVILIAGHVSELVHSEQPVELPHDIADESVMTELEDDLQSAEIRKVAEEALDRIDKKSRMYISYPRVVNKILRSRTITVIGMTTDLIIEACEKEPRNDKKGEHNLINCLVCFMQVWRKPWMRFIDVQKHDCINATRMSEIRKANALKGIENPLD